MFFLSEIQRYELLIPSPSWPPLGGTSGRCQPRWPSAPALSSCLLGQSGRPAHWPSSSHRPERSDSTVIVWSLQGQSQDLDPQVPPLHCRPALDPGPSSLAAPGHLFSLSVDRLHQVQKLGTEPGRAHQGPEPAHSPRLARKEADIYWGSRTPRSWASSKEGVAARQGGPEGKPTHPAERHQKRGCLSGLGTGFLERLQGSEGGRRPWHGGWGGLCPHSQGGARPYYIHGKKCPFINYFILMNETYWIIAIVVLEKNLEVTIFTRSSL